MAPSYRQSYNLPCAPLASLPPAALLLTTRLTPVQGYLPFFASSLIVAWRLILCLIACMTCLRAYSRTLQLLRLSRSQTLRTRYLLSHHKGHAVFLENPPIQRCTSLFYYHDPYCGFRFILSSSFVHIEPSFSIPVQVQ